MDDEPRKQVASAVLHTLLNQPGSGGRAVGLLGSTRDDGYRPTDNIKLMGPRPLSVRGQDNG